MLMITEGKIKVTVMCTAYNHAGYIRQCLEGFVMQKTTFPFEVIVHDDASTDGTADIVREYAERYPDIFVTILQTQNQYSRHVSIMREFLIPIARGGYFAICEGDDYWTDEYKLQKQVEYLDSHPKCAMCFGRARVFNQQEEKFSGEIIGGDKTEFAQLLRWNGIPTLTTIFRRECNESYLQEIRPYEREWKMGDYPRWLYFAAEYGVHFMDDVLGVYRNNAGSVSHPHSTRNLMKFLDSRNDVVRFFCARYGVDPKPLMAYYEEEQVYICAKRNELMLATVRLLRSRNIGFRSWRKLAQRILLKMVGYE